MQGAISLSVLITILIGASFQATGQVVAGEELLCRRPEVLRIVARTLRAADVYSQIDEQSVLEWPSGAPNVVSCTFVTTTIVYGIEAGGNTVPFRVPRTSYYNVRVSGHRVSVEFANPARAYDWPNRGSP